MRILYFDCFNGASGDMILGALLDAGLPLDELGGALGSLGLGELELRADRVLRAGVSATKFRLVEGAGGGAPHGGHDDHAGGHTHPHDHTHAHAHRTLAEILALVDRSALSAAGKARARRLFERLADAEAAVHDVPVERVHLHEVGALDSIVDILGAVFAMEWVRADAVVVSPMNVGSGMVRSAHGVFPVPAPATVRLLGDAPVFARGPQAELLTPTGALLLTGYATRFGTLPPMRVLRVGYGAGDRDFRETPNVLRVLVGEAGEDAGDVATETITVLACEIDDMNPQIFGVLMDQLYAAGALEVFYQPVQMKKNRPGTLVTVIAPPDRREALASLVFRETTTIGVRYHAVQRERLDRETVTIGTPLGAVRFKLARRGGAVVNASPEFDDCARVAAERGRPVKEVQAVAMRAWLEREGHAPEP
jgi:pyridinium-3,5-bisthiocarboxylic acid mononucleotide nickel chelatase